MTLGLNRKREYPLIVRRDTKKDYPYGVLHPTARLVLGLRQSTTLITEDIAEMLEVHPVEIEQFEWEIEQDHEAKYIQGIGLPAAFGEMTPFAVQCVTCKNLITHVPCVQCCKIDGESCRNDHEPELPKSDLGTDAMPGSQLKIAVMAARARENLSIFNPGDRKNLDEPCSTEEYADQHRTQVERAWYEPSERNR